MILVGCATAPVRLRSTVAVTVPVAVPLPRGASPPQPAPEPFPMVSEPSTLACRLAPSSFTSSTLRLSPGGPVFASVRGARASLLVPVAAEAMSAVAEMDGNVVVLRGYVSAGDLPLYSQAPTALGGLVYPHAGTALEWVSSSPGELEVALDTSKLLAWPSVVRAKLPCAKLGPAAGEFELRGFITDKKSLPALVTQSPRAELSLEPNGPVVAALKAGRSVEILESKNGERRVLVDQNGYAIVGWVHASALGTGYGMGFGRLGRSHRVRWRRSLVGRTCAHDLDLVAQVGDAVAQVGKIKAGARFEVLDSAPAPSGDGPPPRLSRRHRTWRSVSFPQLSWLALENDGRLVVEEGALASCSSD